MPTHWESSERPLFVRTVIVNGSRHAILSHVDPLRRTRKSDTSSECYEPNRKIPQRRIRSCYPFKRDVTSELQNCLVKLRVVLSTQEQGKRFKKEIHDGKDGETTRENWKRVKKRIEKAQRAGRDEIIKDAKHDDITGFRRGNRYRRSAIREKDNYEDGDGSNGEIENPAASFAKMAEPTNFVRRVIPMSEATEALLRKYSNYFLPIVYIKPEDMMWDETTTESGITKNNPLSERVLQWLDLARRRKESFNHEKGKNISGNQAGVEKVTTEDKVQNRKKPVRCKSESSLNRNEGEEDVEDEVKNESDIETVLSSTSNRDYPKFSRDLNKLHKLKDNSVENTTGESSPDEEYWEKILTIPEKTEFSLTEQLKQSILESFEAIVHLERKAARERTEMVHSSRKKSAGEYGKPWKKSLLMKQTVIRISSDEDETESVFVRQKTAKRGGYFTQGKKSWKYQQRVKSSAEKSDESGRQVKIIYDNKPLDCDDNHEGRQMWSTEKGANKPHLHIFMPGINPKFPEAHEESASDIESIIK